MRRLTGLMLALILLLCGCAPKESAEATVVLYDYFDTVVTLKVASRDEEKAREILEETFSRLDKVFDCYEEHPGVNGLWALNHAEGAWFRPEPELTELLLRCRDWQTYSPKTDVTCGALYRLWHDFREGGSLPEEADLEQARSLGGWDRVEVDEENGLVRLQIGTELDFGAAAKGYACDVCARDLERNGIEQYILSAGGNVAAGVRQDPYRVAVTDPDGDGSVALLTMTRQCAVTSGGYQRFRELDGVRYHHLIDPDTLYPGETGVLQVTVIGTDSALADFLSTALFLTGYPEGREIAERAGVDAIWVLNDGTVEATEGAKSLMQ